MNERHPIHRAFHLNIMINFLLDLISNLVILAVVLAFCCVLQLMRPDVRLNGYHVFVGLVVPALLFDAILTFLIFADAQNRYGTFSTGRAFSQRAAAYSIACLIALYFARLRMRRVSRPADTRAVVRASPYSESRRPL